jgi:hypothetical protein
MLDRIHKLQTTNEKKTIEIKATAESNRDDMSPIMKTYDKHNDDDDDDEVDEVRLYL